ncbi:Retrovirus-related Pol polyprotein from transposon opus [Ceratobasidium sp. AG-Ba]|nr:Retrovirus-related Pol polyprotein from transposon opus [Ceratobasidium sp. AG-Ba]
MDPMRESEWRHHFIVATRGVTDEERAQLWADWLVYEGVAYDWYEALQHSSTTGLAESKDWTKLEVLIEARWPTPVRDPYVLAEQKRHRWDNSIFRVEDVLAALKDDTNPVQPHEAVLSIQNLTLTPATKPNTRPPVSPYPSSLRRAPTPSPTTPSTPLSQGPIPAPSFAPARAPQVAFAPLLPDMPVRNRRSHENPPHMPDSNPPAAAQAPQTPNPRPMRDPIPELVPNTPEERGRYGNLVSEFNSKFGVRATPTLSKPYPLTPGTFKQTWDVCVRCGRGFHTSVECQDQNPLPESERSMRSAILGSLWRPNARAGTMPGTPTPGQRFVRETAQLEEEDIPYPEHYESENEEGQPGAGHLSCYESSENYLSLDVAFGHAINDVDSYISSPEVVDLYEIFDQNKYKENPFQVWARVSRGDEPGPELDARVTVDGGAMLCVMDKTFWGKIESHLGALAKSPIICRMADGSCTRSIGRGEAVVGVAGQWHPIQFKVLDARGNYDLLLGKPWLRTVGAAQVFSGDTLLISTPQGPIELKNGHPLTATPAPSHPVELTPPPVTQPSAKDETRLTLGDDPIPEVKVEPEGRKELKPGEPAPLRCSKRLRKEEPTGLDDQDNPFWLDGAMVERLEQWVGMSTECEMEDARNEGCLAVESVVVQKVETESEEAFLERMWRLAYQEREEMTQRDILLTELVEQDAKVYRLHQVLDRALRALQRAKGPADVCALEDEDEQRHPTARNRVYTPPTAESERERDPFAQDRVADILRKVTIGKDLTESQRKQVSDLIGEYADIFARSLSEVLPVDFMQMKLDIPEGAQFPKRAGQKRLTEPQRQWLYKTLDDMERAKIIAKVPQDQVAAVSPTSIVPKPGGAELPSLALLRQMANEQCRLYGLPVMWPDVEVEGSEEAPRPTKIKYRLVHNFAAVNKVTQLRPFPMGDLPNMQRKVAGHRWISVMDFMAGFNAIPVAPESVPYTGFHVDGRGYYVYLRMPFGLTGAPTTFCEMVAAAFHNLIGNVLEVWMDDVATACNDFEGGLANLRMIFAKCRAHGLSLSPAKTVLFMSDARFAGARCSSEGVRPDLNKVKAILEWPEPKTALEVLCFLGCVGSYWSKIRNYARIAQPLSDLTRDVRPPQIATTNGKHEYKRALKDTKINLNEAGLKAFAMLKTILTSDTVTRAPIYDGQPFIVTTDGSKYRFGAVLSQEFDVTDGAGVTRKVMYPVAFASKRTSRTEERYIPFLLEFAALKFALDEFDNMIFGQAIELKTDCKALADLLGHDKLNSTHERWRESIIARNIVAV